MNYRRVIFRGWSCIWFLWLSGCASVPKETVALSMAVGEDIQQLYSGYKNTVRFSFEQMRRNGLVVIDEVWTPAYLKTFVREGELLEIAREENWEDLEGWARAAIEDIDAKRSEFVESVNRRETALLAKIDEAFDQATYDSLTEIVRGATDRNEAIATVIDRIRVLGAVGQELAKKIGDITSGGALAVLRGALKL